MANTSRVSDPRIAIVHDYVTQIGGAERVVLSLLRAFPNSRLVTALYDPEHSFPEFRDVEVETLSINRMSGLRTDARRAFPLLAPAFSQHTVKGADILICSSSGWAHGIGGPQPKIVYCHNTARWLYQPADYLSGLPHSARVATQMLGPALRAWDRRAARRAHTYVGNSRAVVARISQAYGLDALLLPPPVVLDRSGPRTPVSGLEPGFLLVVSRGRGYKNVSIVEDAVERLLPNQRLIVVGSETVTGSTSSRVRALGTVSDAQLRWLYSSCGAVVSVAREDFGLTPLEANEFGKPTIVLRYGGYLDTTIEGVSGVFVEEATAEAVADAIRRVPATEPKVLHAHARRFSQERFAATMQQIVGEVHDPSRKAPEG